MQAALAAPWYRHRWPWLLMSGPVIVVVAGLFTAFLAVRSDDGLVAQDYYKRGLLINRQIEKSDRAAGIAALLIVTHDGAVQVRLAGAESVPQSLRLQIAHPTRAGLDRTVPLVRGADGAYGGALGPLPAGRWLVTLESDTWRLPTVEAAAPWRELRLGSDAP